MIRFETTVIAPLRRLRRALERHQYDLLLRMLRGIYYSYDPWLGDEAYRFFHEMTPLPAPIRALFELFQLGRAVETTRIHEALGTGLTEDLCKIGLLYHKGETIATDQYALVSQNGLYFLTTYQSQHNPRRAFHVYIGRDSLKLFHALDHSRRGIRGLDLCAGSGILGQGLLPWATQVTAVELCEEAVDVSRANAVLNGVEKEWEVRQGDLWEPVKGERFDLIVSNPPFVAMPIDVELPIYGWGGKDGLLFIERILAGLPDAFAPGGRAQLVFESVGGPKEAVVVPLLQAFLQEHPTWAATLLVYDRILLSRQSCRLFGESAAHLAGDPSPAQIDAITNQVFTAFQEQGMRYMYRALLTIESEPRGEPGLSLQYLFNPWDQDSIPTFQHAVFLQETPQYTLTTLHGVSLSMNAIERDICASFTGAHTLEQAARHAWEQRGGAASGVDLETFIAQGIELCRVMHQIGFLLPPQDSHWTTSPHEDNPFVQRPEDSPFFQALSQLPNITKKLS